MNINTIRTAIKTTLTSQLPALRVYERTPPDPMPPCVIIGTDDPFVSYPEAMAKGQAEISLVLELLAPFDSWENGQKQLDALLSSGTGETAKSVVDALEAAVGGEGKGRLGTSTLTSVVRSVSAYSTRRFNNGETELLGADLRLTVWTART